MQTERYRDIETDRQRGETDRQRGRALSPKGKK